MTILQWIDIAEVGTLLVFAVNEVADIKETPQTGIEKIERIVEGDTP